jgi:acetoin utilization protein AcuC
MEGATARRSSAISTTPSSLRRLSWSRSAGRNPPAHWFTTLADVPNPGRLRKEVRMRVAHLFARVHTVPELFAEAV